MPRSKTDFTNFIDTRPNYFPGQYLLEDDFEVQHQYLSDRQLYHHKSLHVAGILEGLDVEAAQGQKAVSIKSGSAIDGNGNLIVFKKDTVFSGFGNVTTGELYIQYTQLQQVKQQNEIPDSFTRWQEVPVVQFAAKAPDNTVKLASLAIANDVITLNLTVRVYSGVFLPNPAGNDLTLRSGGSANSNLAVLSGSLSLTGDLAVTGAITGKIDTANITSGILSSDRIPNLSSDKITTGTLNVARIPNLSADKITAGTITGNLTITGNTNIGATTIGSQINIDLSGHLQLKEYGTGSLAFLQARDDTSNRDIGLRLRTQTKGVGSATKPTLVEAFTITPSGNVGIGAASDTFKLSVQGDQYLSGILAIGDVPFIANSGGHREWMTKGIKVFWNSDSLYLGLKDEGDNRKDAVIAWGDDATDNLRFIFAGAGGAVQGSEVMKLAPNGDLSVTGFLALSSDLSVTGSVSFGSTVRQMINLWSTKYGIGIQDGTQYFRTDANFAWYRGGSHYDKALNAGTDGTTQMSLDRLGNLFVAGALLGNAGDSNGAALREMFGSARVAFDYTGSIDMYCDTGKGFTKVKTFVIEHPLNRSKYLVHGTLEGPEASVFYRGSSQLIGGKAEITLPSYFEALTKDEDRTILLTNVNGFERLMVMKIGKDKIQNGKFYVVSDNHESSQEFDWEVKAVRKDVSTLLVEPDKCSYEVKGFGPYTYTTPSN